MEQNADTGVQMTPVVDDKKKNGNGLKIATAIACIVAVCGIGFGIYGMMQSSQKDNQISDLTVQIKEDDGTITTIDTPEIETTTNDGTTVVISDSTIKKQNPIVESDALDGATLSNEFAIRTDAEHRLHIGIKDGKIDSCYIDNKQCEITGLNSNIYKMIEFMRGLDSSGTHIGFIMEDGTINYFKFGCNNDGCETRNSYSVNKLKLDGFVVDALSIRVPQENYGGYPSTVFILKDGSYLQFSDSML